MNGTLDLQSLYLVQIATVILLLVIIAFLFFLVRKPQPDSVSDAIWLDRLQLQLRRQLEPLIMLFTPETLKEDCKQCKGSGECKECGSARQCKACAGRGFTEKEVDAPLLKSIAAAARRKS